MSQALIDIFKKNSQELESIKKEVMEIKQKVEKIENETNIYSDELKDLSQKSYYIEKYLENIQNKEIEDILKDEDLE
jgi:predicted  nucleic acid-binding Zn-ribbon protein